MQQRQPRLGDILDDYCPRERRLTNHAVVAMIGDEIKQTRCTTCESEHEYKHARLPKQRKKSEQAELYSQVLAAVTPKKVVVPDVAPVHRADRVPDAPDEPVHDAQPAWLETLTSAASAIDVGPVHRDLDEEREADDADEDEAQPTAPEEGPLHRRLIRAQLPRHEGQVVIARKEADFTIRQPATGRPNRFRQRPGQPPQQQQSQRGQHFQGNRSGGGNAQNGNRAGGPRQGGRPQGRPGHRQGAGRNRSK